MSHRRTDTTDLRAKLAQGNAGQQIIAKRLLNRAQRRALESKRKSRCPGQLN